MPIEIAGPLTKKAIPGMCEGAIDMYIGDVGVITRELTWWGYLFSWWDSSLSAVEDLFQLKSTVWYLPGKVLKVPINVIPGTRRVTVQLYNTRNGEYGPIAKTHVKTLTDAILDGAEAYVRWCGEFNGIKGLTIANIERLRTATAPWKPKHH